ncbi:hypothetical protein TNCT_5221, partial [Trichonephila clavata]
HEVKRTYFAEEYLSRSTCEFHLACALKVITRSNFKKKKDPSLHHATARNFSTFTSDVFV